MFYKFKISYFYSLTIFWITWHSECLVVSYLSCQYITFRKFKRELSPVSFSALKQLCLTFLSFFELGDLIFQSLLILIHLSLCSVIEMCLIYSYKCDGLKRQRLNLKLRESYQRWLWKILRLFVNVRMIESLKWFLAETGRSQLKRGEGIVWTSCSRHGIKKKILSVCDFPKIYTSASSFS